MGYTEYGGSGIAFAESFDRQKGRRSLFKYQPHGNGWKVFDMIRREDILSMEFLKKTEFTGCCQGMRYRLEGVSGEEGKRLRCTVWPEPFNFFKTPEEEKETAEFPFEEDGVTDAVAWMNDRLFEEKDKWDNAGENWDRFR